MKRQLINGRLEIPRTFLNNMKVKDNDYIDIIMVNDIIALHKSPDTLLQPKQVQGISVNAIGNSLELTWSYETDSLFYIFKGTTNNVQVTLNQPYQVVASLKRWTDYEVLRNQIYYYKIVACDHKGHFSIPSILVSGKVSAAEMPLVLKVDREQKKKLA